MNNIVLKELFALNGTFVNVAAIIIGSSLGQFAGSGLKKKYGEILEQGIGLSLILIGLSSALMQLFKPDIGKTLFMVSLVIGGMIGEWLDIEGKITSFTNRIQRRFRFKSDLSKGFAIATETFCIGSMAILGALKSGLQGDHSMLYTKAIIDGIVAIIFASTLGIGVLFSFIPVLIYQGMITIFSEWVRPLMTEALLTEISLVGGILIMGIGLNILKITKIKLGNFIPALFIPIIYYSIISFFI